MKGERVTTIPTPNIARSNIRRLDKVEKTRQLPLQQIYGLVDVCYSEVLGKGWVTCRDSLKHLVGDAAIAPVTTYPGAQFADVHDLGEIHLEQSAFAVGKRKQILRGLNG
jgi:hypothetical protein